jgi:hypothetical protein
MEAFFRFAGLSLQLSKRCAEEAIVYDISSPKKLYKYLQEEEGFSLIKLGMDNVDSDMVLETLNREFQPKGANNKSQKSLTSSSRDDHQPLTVRRGSMNSQRALSVNIPEYKDNSDDDSDNGRINVSQLDDVFTHELRKSFKSPMKPDQGNVIIVDIFLY